MNPAVAFFASGDSLYLGIFLLLLAIVASPNVQRRWLLLTRNVVSWFALVMMAMASPPFPWGIDLAVLVAFALWFVAVNVSSHEQTWVKLRWGAAIALFLLLLPLAASELSHRRTPLIVGVPSDHLVVIGDSISSGIDSRYPAWPSLLQQMTGVPVKNLARPGATVIEARSMAENVLPEDRIVVVEIGGNDLLSGTASIEFERQLALLLSKLASPGRTVVMFELPLLPNRIAYGRIQRRLASKYSVWLIPKRYFVDVMSGAGATPDGLHLSPQGTSQMALLAGKILSPLLRRGNAVKLAKTQKI
jgi:acyl-CoA thioesterase-1